MTRSQRLTLVASTKWRCRCPLEVVNTVRRTVRKLVESVNMERDTMVVIGRQRYINGSLGTAKKPNYKKALPLLRAIAALVTLLPISNLLQLKGTWCGSN